MKDMYSEYSLKIYADTGKLEPRNHDIFIITNRFHSTTCYELKQKNKNKVHLTLKDIDTITSAFYNKFQLLDYFFIVHNIYNIPTVRIYKKRKNYQLDGKKEIELDPLYCSQELSLLLDATKEDGLLLNKRKKSYRMLKAKYYDILFQEKNLLYIKYILENKKECAISDQFLQIYEEYQNVKEQKYPKKQQEIKKKLEKFEKEQLNHYSKMRGFIIAYQNYKKDMELQQVVTTKEDKKDSVVIPSWEEQLLNGKVDLVGISSPMRNELINYVNELQNLKEKVDALKYKSNSSIILREIEKTEQSIQKKMEQLKMIYEQMQMDACVVDDDIEGFDEEMEKGTILFSGSHR